MLLGDLGIMTEHPVIQEVEAVVIDLREGGSYPNLKPPRTPLEHTGATCSPLMSSRPELSGDEKRYPTAKY